MVSNFCAGHNHIEDATLEWHLGVADNGGDERYER